MNFKNYRGNEVAITLDHARDALLTDFGKQTLKDRYLLPGETPQTLFARVAAYYSDDEIMAQEMYDAISKLWFMPATPVLSNGGTDRGNPISCFLTHVEDSLDSILATNLENGWLAAKGGGIGTNWSAVRSIDEDIGADKQSVGKTSGVIPFIKIQDSQTLGISQGSLRRGSAAVYMDISHPEIEEFISIRKPSGADFNRKCFNIHHGVNVSDAFMEAVVAGGTFDLVSPKDGTVRKTVVARDLWMKLLDMRLATGEPYIVFIDTVNRRRPESYVKHGLRVLQSNLCSEIALTTGQDHHNRKRTAVCCLGSVNVVTSREWFGNRRFLRNCLVFLDNVMTDFIARTENEVGFEHARYSAERERSIGLGWMGFHSYLQDEGIPFESTLAHYENTRFWSWLRQTGEEINVEVAGERGANPDCEELGIQRRWTHMFAIAPTASISIIAGTVSACHEPFPANVYTAKTLSGSFEVRNPALERRLNWYADLMFDHMIGYGDMSFAKKRWIAEAWKAIADAEGSVQGLTWMLDHDKAVFRTWEEIDQIWVIQHAATRSRDNCGPDQMASNNISLPADISRVDLHKLHKMAWEKGVPSLYYCRSKSVARVKRGDVAGEMPSPTPAHDLVLKDRGEKVEAFIPSNEVAAAPEEQSVAVPEVSKYDECLVCQ